MRRRDGELDSRCASAPLANLQPAIARLQVDRSAARSDRPAHVLWIESPDQPDREVCSQFPVTGTRIDVAVEVRRKRDAHLGNRATDDLHLLQVRQALDRQEAFERKKKLAADYAADRDDARELLKDLEAGQTELLE